MKYYKEYSEELLEVLTNFKFTKEQKKEYNKAIKTLHKNSPVREVFKDMYIFYQSEFSMIEIGKIYNRSPRTIQLAFKKAGLNRDRFEAQRIATKKRNYIEIRKSYKKTMKERFLENTLFGSKVEQYARIELLQTLQEITPYEVIVGINTVTNSGELDIPIIIIKDDKVFKFGVEVDGAVFHKDRRQKDYEKVKALKDEGYQVYRVDTKACYDGHVIKYKREFQKKLQGVCYEIKESLMVI